jgi:hypothetical protein
VADHEDQLTDPSQQQFCSCSRFEACVRRGRRKDADQELLDWTLLLTSLSPSFNSTTHPSLGLFSFFLFEAMLEEEMTENGCV